ncbi:hypothetical protein ACIBLA_06570 [Streptomyces sp. NPDC050433]|uniref:hypothetical protein n=1 Tax=Streptomyces sp. NPDC050433 TaxID=3365615 RepID=UPI0037AD8FA5
MAPVPEKPEQASESSALNRLAPKNRDDSPDVGRKRNLVRHSGGSGKTMSFAALAAARINPKSGLFLELKGGARSSPLTAHLVATASYLSAFGTLAVDSPLHDLGKRVPSWQLLHWSHLTTRLPSPFLGRDSRAARQREATKLIEQYNASIAYRSLSLNGGGGSLFTTGARRLGNPEKSLIEQIKAPMTATEAQRLSERLKAEDGPRRKLPPRP